jgi:cytochrome c biogenesis protein CcmG/thiol:disulfide interchange protein DsbE
VATSTTNRPGSDAKAAAARRQRLIVLAVGVVVIAVVALVAVLSAGESGSAVAVEDVAGSPTIEGEELPQAGDDPTADPSLGSPAPVTTGQDFDGSTVTIGEPGSPTMVMFLASWCPACQEELPQVIQWIDSGAVPADVEIVAVATGLDHTRPNWPPDAWLDREGWTGPTLVDDAQGSVATAYGLGGTPYWVALDDQGQVVARVVGMLGQEQLTALAEAAAAGA